MLTWDNIQSNAIAFSKRWKDGRSEEAQAQSFTTAFLQVFGVEDPISIGDYGFSLAWEIVGLTLKMHNPVESDRQSHDIRPLRYLDKL